MRWAEYKFTIAKLCFGHGTTNAWDEAVFIASYVLDLDLYQDNINIDLTVLNKQQQDKFVKIALLRIKTKQPVAYIIKTAWFAGKKYYIDRRAIVPRSPFAELIKLRFKPWLPQTPAKILDLCTGSGCMAIACYHAFFEINPNIRVDAVDISSKALAVAAKNLKLHRLRSKVNLIKSDLFKNIPKHKYDLIISNPPYVDLDTFKKLPKEFKFEPKLALLSGKTGLEIVYKILSSSNDFLADHGILIVEVGYLWKVLQKSSPKFRFTWIKLKHGGEGIFVISKKELQRFLAD